MGNTAFSTLYGRVQRRVGDTSTTTLAKIKEAINDVARDIFYDKFWSFREESSSFSFEDGTKDYSLATDVDIVHDLYYAEDDGHLEFKPRKIFVNSHPKDTDSGTPTEFTMWDVDANGKKQVRVWKVPDSAFVNDYTTGYYDYYKTYTEMSDDDDTCSLPPSFDRIIVEAAADIILAALGKIQPEMAVVSDQKLYSRVERKKGKDVRSSGGSPMRGIDSFLAYKRQKRVNYR